MRWSHGIHVSRSFWKCTIYISANVLTKPFIFSVIVFDIWWRRVSFWFFSKIGVFPYTVILLKYETTWNSDGQRSRMEIQKGDSIPQLQALYHKMGSPFWLQSSKQMLLKLCFMSGMTQSILTEKIHAVLTSKGIQPHRTWVS